MLPRSRVSAAAMAVVAIVLAGTLLGVVEGADHCLNCNACKRVELTSHSAACPKDQGNTLTPLDEKTQFLKNIAVDLGSSNFILY